MSHGKHGQARVNDIRAAHGSPSNMTDAEISSGYTGEAEESPVTFWDAEAVEAVLNVRF
jgi:hypothetical protein